MRVFLVSELQGHSRSLEGC